MRRAFYVWNSWILLKKIKLKKKNLSNLQKLMTVRGPDGRKHEIRFKNNYRISFFHSRFKIIDPLSRSSQPMIDENGLLIFNGMIYNYLEIKKDLLSKKIHFENQFRYRGFIKIS